MERAHMLLFHQLLQQEIKLAALELRALKRNVIYKMKKIKIKLG
jgi:hypothetical protein